MHRPRLAALALFAALTGPVGAQTLTLLSAGAFKQVARAVVPAFEAASGLRVEITTDTAGGLLRRIEAGQAFDVVVVTREGIARLARGGQVAAGSGVDVATAGIGVGIAEGRPAPPLATVDDVKTLLRSARAVAYVDPASGGSSGIYLDGLFARLGLADVVRPKAVLVAGGLAAERVARGDADVALQQVSEILGVPGVALAGLLPEAIQSHTTYAAGLAQRSAHPQAAQALLKALTSAQAAQAVHARGMVPPP